MKLLAILPLTLFLATAQAFADDIRGLQIGAQYSELSTAFNEGKIITEPDYIGKELGFRTHSIDSNKVMLNARSNPNGELYHIGFSQLVPFKQADEFKNALCSKYRISPCDWSDAMRKNSPGATIYQFDRKRQDGDIEIRVSVNNATMKSQKGFVWASASINAGRPDKLVKAWKLRLKKEEQARKLAASETAAKEASNSAERVEMKF